MSWISGTAAFFSTIRACIELYFYFRKLRADAEALEVEKRRANLQAAYDDLNKARTEEEIFDAQRRILHNDP